MKIGGPKLLVTGFGPFPGAPENPTEKLVRALAEVPAAEFGARAITAMVLPTEYARSWRILRRLHASFEPDVIIHFGLAGRAKAIRIETVGRNVVDPTNPDAAGLAPRSGKVRRGGSSTLPVSLSTQAVFSALKHAGVAAELSEDAGDYVCNATLYRSLHAAPENRRVGFIHVPPVGRRFGDADLLAAARIVLREASRYSLG